MMKRISALFGAIALGIALTIAMVFVLLALQVTETSAAPLAQPPFPDQRDSLEAAVGWLMSTAQNADGGFKQFGGSAAGYGPSDAKGTIVASLALYSAGFDPGTVYVGKTESVVDWMDGNPDALTAQAAQSGGAAGEVVMGLVAACQDPRDFHGYNLVISTTSRFSPSTGIYSDSVEVLPFRQSLAILGLATVSETIPVTATRWLTENQQSGGADDGCWLGSTAFGPPVCDIDGTAMSIMALLAAGVPKTNTHVVSATNYLSRTQAASGGWESWGAFSVNSTALALQALAAQGEDFYTASSDNHWAKGGVNTPLSALLQGQDSRGPWTQTWNPDGDNYSTFWAIPAVAGKHFPLKGRCEAARRGLLCLKTLQDGTDATFPEFADTGWGTGEKASGTSRAIEAISMCSFPSNPQLTDPQSAYWTENSIKPIEALDNVAAAYIAGGKGGRVGKVMRGVVRSNSTYTVTNFAGGNLVVSMTNHLQPDGRYDDNMYGQPHAMLGLAYAGFPISPTAVSWVLNEKSDGWWSVGGFDVGPDTAGQVLQALAAAGTPRQHDVVAELKERQLASGAWAGWSSASENSTAEAVKGLIAQNENPNRPTWSKVVSGVVVSPVDWLIAQQSADGCWVNSDVPTLKDPYDITDAVMMLCSDYPWPIEISYLPIIYKDSQ
jgi:hypothetical protein